MIKFSVLGLRESGEVHSLVLDAADASQARRQASERGFCVLEVAPLGRAWAPWQRERAATGRVDVALFCQELLALLSAGITVGEALDTLFRKEERSASAQAAGRLLGRVREGLPLSAAMAEETEVFPRLLVESIRASERTSDYGPALTRFIRYQRMASEMRAKAVSAALYPMILLGVSGAVLLFLLGYVVPRFAQVYAEMGDKLPWSSRLLLMVGQAIGARPELTAAAAGLAVLIGLFAWHSQQLKSMGLDLLRRIPNIRRLLTTAEAARMYRTLALLVHGGIALVPALRIVRGLLSGDAARRLDGAIKAVSEGRPFSESMKDAALSTVIADRFIRVGEQTGRLGDMLDRAAEFHEDDLGRTADRVGRVLGPVMMLFMGAVIGLVVVMMYLPIFQLADAIQ